MTARKKKETGSEVVEQFLAITRGNHRVAAIFGGVLGAVIPISSYIAFHLERNTSVDWYQQPAMWVVAAGLTWSAPKVSVWGKQAFGSWISGVCFAIILEAIMIFFHTVWLAGIALAILVAINAIVAGSSLATRKTAKPSWMM